MPKIVVLGGGVCGLAAGMMLARDGHEVTLLERDPEPVPESAEAAWEGWSRGGVVQFRQAHYLQPRGRHVLAEELPDVLDALIAAGGLPFDPLSVMPPFIADREPRSGDERFATVTARRPTIEQVFGRAAEAEPRLDVRRGTGVSELVATPLDGTPHVTGIRTEDGEELGGDLVVDATGRRSPLPRWLDEAGAAPLHEEAEDSGFIYYSRFFRVRGGEPPPPLRSAPLTPIGSFSILLIPGDNETWSVTLYISTGDRPLKRLRDRERWTAVVGACPLHAHWLDGEPLTDVLAMSGVVDRYRRLCVDGRPVATGVAPLGDSWACTNPSLGRGIALGLVHAQRLRDVVRAHLDDPRSFSEAWDEVTEAELTPWYRETVAEDHARLAEIEALREGLEPERPVDGEAAVRAALPVAMLHDPDVFRAMLETRCCLTPMAQVLTRPGLSERVVELAREHGAPPTLGPSREEVLSLLS
jgi:2-polyprenyl-6-methoxyphenol hydroxylase-like FAD-dependent oxidoreductase